MAAKKRVAIIGAGASGLAAIKCCLDEGLEPVCLEQSDEIGGLWFYREQREDQSCVFQSTVINTSKESMCFSDFPIPEDFPNYMHNRMVFKYFQLYCDQFKLRQHIRFKTKVVSAVFADDYEETGRWSVTTVSPAPGQDGKTVTEIYDALLVCTGHHCTPHIPQFEGLQAFRGKVLHTHDYLNPTGFENKKILIIGVGNSGCDAAVELGRTASKLFLSTRRGTWIIHRLGDRGIPIDMANINRLFTFVPGSLKAKLFESALQKRVDHKFLGVQPDHSPIAQHPTVNDFLPNCIMNGSVIMKPDVQRFTKTGVVFQDGTEEDLDVVILGTGYIFRFPFLQDSVVKVEDNRLPFYKYVFPPDLAHPTLAFLGYIQPLGAINPIAELQGRWATRVFSGRAALPRGGDMHQDMRDKEEDMRSRYYTSQRHSIQVDFIEYMDDVAAEIGVKPNFWRMLVTDPVLAAKCVLGPYTPYQYRLAGPGQWKGARGAIMTLWDRINKPLQTRRARVMEKKGGFSSIGWLLAFIGVLVAFYVYMYCV